MYFIVKNRQIWVICKRVICNNWKSIDINQIWCAVIKHIICGTCIIMCKRFLGRIFRSIIFFSEIAPNLAYLYEWHFYSIWKVMDKSFVLYIFWQKHIKFSRISHKIFASCDPLRRNYTPNRNRAFFVLFSTVSTF